MWTDEIRRGTKGFDSLTIKFRGSQSIFPETNTGTSKFDQTGNWELLFVAFLETNDEKQRCWNCWWLRRSSIHWFYVCNHNSAFACRSNLPPDWIKLLSDSNKRIMFLFPVEWHVSTSCILLQPVQVVFMVDMVFAYMQAGNRQEKCIKWSRNYTSNLKIASLWRVFLRPKKVYETLPPWVIYGWFWCVVLVTLNRCARFRLESRFGSLYSMPSLNRFLHTSHIHMWISKFGPIVRGPTWKA